MGCKKLKPTKVLIDWYSFTLFYLKQGGTAYDIMDRVNETLYDAIPKEWDAINYGTDIEWLPARGRSPYVSSYSALNGGMTVFVNPSLDHFLVEISGKGCARLSQSGVLDGIIENTYHRSTRIDIAVDIQTDTSPKEFVDGGVNGKFSARSSISSKDGETEYIGSRKSERYCRVYKYNEPHVRAGWLRCEFVFKKKSAKMFAENIAKGGFQLNRVANGCRDIYMFEHQDWDIRGTAIDIKNYTPERGDSKTLFWFRTAVIPAFNKLVKNGVIDNPKEWLLKEFLDE